MSDCTGKKALQLSKSCDMPFAWDDPTSADDVAFIVQALFNQAGRDTVISSGKPRRPPLITANFTCAHDNRIFSREAIILFEGLNPKHPLNERTTLVRNLEKSTKEASKGLLECLKSVCMYLEQGCTDPEDFVSSKVECVFNRVRSQEIYATLMWFTQDIMKRGGVEDDIPIVWEYVEDTLAPFVNGLFNQKLSVSNTSSFSFEVTIKNLEDRAMALSQRELSYDIRMTKIDGIDWLAISSSCLTPQEKLALKEHIHVKSNSKATRLRFLSKESDVDYFKIIQGVDVEGKSHSKVCICVPTSLMRNLSGRLTTNDLEAGAEGVNVQHKVEERDLEAGAEGVNVQHKAEEQDLEAGAEGVNVQHKVEERDLEAGAEGVNVQHKVEEQDVVEVLGDSEGPSNLDQGDQKKKKTAGKRKGTHSLVDGLSCKAALPPKRKRRQTKKL